MDWIDLLQWPAMVVTVTAAWQVASPRRSWRNWGFYTFLCSNALWIAWGAYASAWGLVALQFALAGMNVRGAWRSTPGHGTPPNC